VARSMFERFTDRARQAAEVFAEEEARTRRHDWIGTEHLLLGLLRDDDGMAIKALTSLDISPEAARQQDNQLIEEAIGMGNRTPRAGRLPFTPRSRHVLELSAHEAYRLGHDHITTGHVLLALIRETDGLAGQVLAKLGAHLATAREQLAELLRDGNSEE
jgi:ATP-dependent Clp protease ATP-binding subunit ClpC